MHPSNVQTILCTNLIKCSSSSQTAVHTTPALQKTKELLHNLSLSKCCLHLSTAPGCTYVVRRQFLGRTNRVSRLYCWHLFPLHSSILFFWRHIEGGGLQCPEVKRCFGEGKQAPGSTWAWNFCKFLALFASLIIQK